MAKLDEHICRCNRCEILTRNSVIVARGSKTEFRLNNDSKLLVSKYIVDDCLLYLRGDEEKCDFLYLVTESNVAYFVECKGSDLLKAISQIDSSIKIISSQIKGYVLKARIVTTRVYSPDIRSQSYRSLRKVLNGQLEIKNIKLVENI